MIKARKFVRKTKSFWRILSESGGTKKKSFDQIMCKMDISILIPRNMTRGGLEFVTQQALVSYMMHTGQMIVIILHKEQVKE